MPEKKKSFEFTGWYLLGNPGIETVGSQLLLTPSQWGVRMRGLPSWRLALGGTEKGSVSPQKNPVYWRLPWFRRLTDGQEEILHATNVPFSPYLQASHSPQESQEGGMHNEPQPNEQQGQKESRATWSSKGKDKSPWSSLSDMDKVTFFVCLVNEQGAFCYWPWV